MKRSLIAATITAAVLTSGFLGFETARFVTASPQLSTDAEAKPMSVVQVDPSWIKSGNPTFTQVEIATSPDGRTVNGLWSCQGPTTFEWQFSVDEVVYVIEGEVQVNYQGRDFTLHPGDTAAFHGGTRSVWTVDTFVKKAYTLHNPGPLGRLWRDTFPAR
ncbi:MAG: cupin domain-containing protein [Propionibacteriales bacterium]|jgi:uncharacterized cupin superfamily protein|nr:cupin domain-containing protein [Propionibacteriales bacterium]